MNTHLIHVHITSEVHNIKNTSDRSALHCQSVAKLDARHAGSTHRAASRFVDRAAGALREAGVRVEVDERFHLKPGPKFYESAPGLGCLDGCVCWDGAQENHSHTACIIQFVTYYCKQSG